MKGRRLAPQGRSDYSGQDFTDGLVDTVEPPRRGLCEKLRARRARQVPAVDPQEREFIYRGLIEAIRLVNRPTDRPDLDKAEIKTRISAAAEAIRLGRL